MTTPDEPGSSAGAVSPPHPHLEMLEQLNEEFAAAPVAVPPKGPLTLPLPPATLAAGRWTLLSFFLGWESFILAMRWAPGFRIRRLSLGRKDFGDGTKKVDGRYYTQHRVLKAEQIQIEVENTTQEDRMFSGSITIEVSPIAAPTDFTCSIDLPTDDTLPGVAPEAST